MSKILKGLIVLLLAIIVLLGVAFFVIYFSQSRSAAATILKSVSKDDNRGGGGGRSGVNLDSYIPSDQDAIKELQAKTLWEVMTSSNSSFMELPRYINTFSRLVPRTFYNKQCMMQKIALDLKTQLNTSTLTPTTYLNEGGGVTPKQQWSSSFATIAASHFSWVIPKNEFLVKNKTSFFNLYEGSLEKRVSNYRIFEDVYQIFKNTLSDNTSPCDIPYSTSMGASCYLFAGLTPFLLSTSYTLNLLLLERHKTTVVDDSLEEKAKVEFVYTVNLIFNEFYRMKTKKDFSLDLFNLLTWRLIPLMFLLNNKWIYLLTVADPMFGDPALDIYIPLLHKEVWNTQIEKVYVFYFNVKEREVVVVPNNQRLTLRVYIDEEFTRVGNYLSPHHILPQTALVAHKLNLDNQGEFFIPSSVSIEELMTLEGSEYKPFSFLMSSEIDFFPYYSGNDSLIYYHMELDYDKETHPLHDKLGDTYYVEYNSKDYLNYAMLQNIAVLNNRRKESIEFDEVNEAIELIPLTFIVVYASNMHYICYFRNIMAETEGGPMHWYKSNNGYVKRQPQFDRDHPMSPKFFLEEKYFHKRYYPTILCYSRERFDFFRILNS